MSEVIGPTSKLPGAAWDVPDGAVCDTHSDRAAVARIQGETDSFGAELFDMCQECLKEFRAWKREGDHSGECDWCHLHKPRLSPQRDYEEGFYGRVYDVCDDCIRRRDARIEQELDDIGQ